MSHLESLKDPKVWGSLVGAAAILVGFLGVSVPAEMQELLSQNLATIVGSVSAVALTVFGIWQHGKNQDPPSA